MSGLLGKSNIGGGAGGKAFAAISVTYPAGSVCTCSSGSKTLKAKDTSGRFLFTVPFGGEWTVKAENGATGEYTDTTVSVSANNVYSVQLVYRLYIVKNGILQTPFVFDRNLRSAYPATTKQEDDVFVVQNVSGQGSAVAASTIIDATSYSTLYADYSNTKNEFTTPGCAIVLSDGAVRSGWRDVINQSYASVVDTFVGRKTRAITIPDDCPNCYVGIVCVPWTGVQVMHFWNLWLE